jgi:hypothetical protein
MEVRRKGLENGHGATPVPLIPWTRLAKGVYMTSFDFFKQSGGGRTLVRSGSKKLALGSANQLTARFYILEHQVCEAEKKQ